MKFKQNSILFCITAILILGCKNAIKKNPDQESNNSDTYALVNDWPRLPANFTLGSPTGLGLDSKGNIIAFHRSGREWKTMPISHKSAIKENTISKIDSNTGEIIKSWGSDLFIMPHGLEVDNQDKRKKCRDRRSRHFK